MYEHWRTAKCRQAEEEADDALIKSVVSRSPYAAIYVGNPSPALYVEDASLMSAWVLARFFAVNSPYTSLSVDAPIQMLELERMSLRTVRRLLREQVNAASCEVVETLLVLVIVSTCRDRILCWFHLGTLLRLGKPRVSGKFATDCSNSPA